MPFEHVKVGDILFFSAPSNPLPSVLSQIAAQIRLSLWSCSCCSKDYELTHVAICISKDVENIRIAHIRVSKMPDYRNVSHNGFCIDDKRFMEDTLSKRKYLVLRPKSDAFAAKLANCAGDDTKNSQINWSDETYDHAHSFCSCCSQRKNPPNELSQETICSRFVAEVVENTQEKFSCFDQANVCVMTLKRRLSQTGLFNLILQDELDAHDNRRGHFTERSHLLSEQSSVTPHPN